MYSKIWPLIALAYFLPQYSSGQNEKVHYIALNNDEISRESIKNRNFHIVNVVDGRQDTLSHLGTKKKRTATRMDYLDFENSLGKEVERYIMINGLKESQTKKSEPVWIRITNFVFGEYEAYHSNVASLALSIEFYSLENKLLYASSKKRRIVDQKAARYHASNFAELMHQTMELFNFVDKSSYFCSDYISGESEIITEPPAKGFYGSEFEMLNNCPSFIFDFNVSTYPDIESHIDNAQRVTFHIDDSNFHHDKFDFIASIYGFCDGQGIFLKENTPSGKYHFNELTLAGKYGFYSESSPAYNYAPVIIGAMLGGIVGARIATQNFNSVKAKSFEYLIDLVSGEVRDLTPECFDDLMYQNEKIYAAYSKRRKHNFHIKSYWLEALSRAQGYDISHDAVGAPDYWESQK